MKNRVITISREFGSGGRTIGKQVAEKLGIPCYDNELLTKIAQDSGFDENYVQETDEYAPGGFLSNAFSHYGANPNNADYLWQIQYKIISELAEQGPCVIVGRCADYILQNKADCLKVFIHADMAFRTQRIVEVYGEREQSPEQRIWDKDKRRAAYHRFYTDMKWGTPRTTISRSTVGPSGSIGVWISSKNFIKAILFHSHLTVQALYRAGTSMCCCRGSRRIPAPGME